MNHRSFVNHVNIAGLPLNIKFQVCMGFCTYTRSMPLPSAWQTGMDVASHPMGDPLVLAEMELGRLPHHSDGDRRVEETRRKSLHRMSQQYRGITLQELKELRDDNDMREQRWFCINYPLKCKFSRKSDESPNAPCPSCGAESGKIRAKNLYELVNDVVKPKCQAQQISYVEFLKGRDGRAHGRKVWLVQSNPTRQQGVTV